MANGGEDVPRRRSALVPRVLTFAGAVALLGLLWPQLSQPDVVEPPEAIVPIPPADLPDPTDTGPVPDGYRFSFDRDQIRPIHDPVFVPASEAGWGDDILVLGVAINGEAHAYPINVLNFREIVTDTVGGVPVTASWCPLCATAIVHRRVVDGDPIVLGNQGDLYLNGMVMYDHRTGSIWSQPQGRAILGELEGTTLEVLPSTLTSWGTWRADHPDTLALAAEGGSSGFSLDRMAIVVEVDGQTRAYPVPLVRERGVVNDELAGEPIAVVVDRTDRWLAVSRRVDGQTVELSLDDGRLTAGDRAWSATSLVALDDGPALTQRSAWTSFRQEYLLHHPDGAIWEP